MLGFTGFAGVELGVMGVTGVTGAVTRRAETVEVTGVVGGVGVSWRIVCQLEGRLTGVILGGGWGQSTKVGTASFLSPRDLKIKSKQNFSIIL